MGPAGYGLLSSAPAAGALLGTVLVFRLIRSRPAGRIVLAGSASYGLAAVLLARSPAFWIALLAAVAVGSADAVATSIRHAAIQVETPDAIRGRVTSLYQMTSRGGPALGDAGIGWLAGLVGPVAALSMGGVVPVAYAAALALRRGTVSSYRIPSHSPTRGGHG